MSTDGLVCAPRRGSVLCQGVRPPALGGGGVGGARIAGAFHGTEDADRLDSVGRADLFQQRPDIAKDWLEAELDAEQYIADPKNALSVAKLVAAQTTGFTEKQLWQALFGTYPTDVGGTAIRETVPFGFTPASLGLIKTDTAFLYSIKSIAIPQLASDAVLPYLTAGIMKERGLSAPIGQVAAQPGSAYH